MTSNAPVLQTRNVGILAGGTALAQAVPLLASPILTRIFSPEEFGVFALYMAMTAIIGSVSTMRYEMAIPLAESENKAVSLAFLSIGICVIVSCLALFLIIVFESFILNALGNEQLSTVLYLVPVGILLIGLTSTLNNLNLRFDRYAVVAKANLMRSVSAVFSQLALGFAKIGVLGLSIGSILGGLFAAAPLAQILSGKTEVNDRTALRKLIVEYADFPKFSVWGAFANTGSVHITNVLIGVYVSLASAGLYSLVARTMGAPTLVVGNAIGQVFYQQAGACIRSRRRIEPLFLNTLVKLLVLSAIGFGLVYAILEDMFAWVFGEEWRSAGLLATIMLPVFAMRFVTAPLSMVNGLHLENKVGLIANILLLTGTIGAMTYAFEQKWALEEGLKLLSASQFVFYAIYLVLLWNRVRANDDLRVTK